MQLEPCTSFLLYTIGTYIGSNSLSFHFCRLCCYTYISGVRNTVT